jgi:hypothetical protein
MYIELFYLIWHKISKHEVLKFSPTLADKMAQTLQFTYNVGARKRTKDTDNLLRPK